MIDVYNDEELIVDGATMEEGDEGWSGSLSELPIGPTLTFQAVALDAAGLTIFGGSTTTALDAVEEEVSIDIIPSELTFSLPQVLGIGAVGDLIAGLTGSVLFNLGGNGEALTYDITSGGGTFLPAEGSIPLLSGIADLLSVYLPPLTPGEYTHEILVTDANNYSVRREFTTDVLSALSGVGLGVRIGPSLRGLIAERQGTKLIWEVLVDDDGGADGVDVEWSFIGDGASFTSNGNPATLSGYTTALSGILKLTLTDSDGLVTELSYSLLPGVFPD